MQAGQLSLMNVVVDVAGAAVVLPGGEVSAVGATPRGQCVQALMQVHARAHTYIDIYIYI